MFLVQMLRRALRVAIVAACAGVTSACSLFFDLGRVQCDSAAECQNAGFVQGSCEENVCVEAHVGSGGGGGGGGEGGTPDPAWACLGSFSTPVPGDGELVAHDFRFEYATQAAVPPVGLAIKLCASVDVGCQAPLSGIPQPDAKGAVVLEQPASFRGFLEVTSDDTMATIVYLQPPVLLPPKQNLIRMIRPNEFTAIVAAAKQTYDPTRGVGLVLTDNCLDERADGVVLESEDADAEAVAFYFRGALPDPEAKSTDEQGAGGWLNLPTQIVTVVARRLQTGEFIGETSFDTRPNTITYVPLGPTPE